jgi:hypothetical protein
MPALTLQFLGGTFGLAIAQTTFSSELQRNLRKYVPDAPFETIEQSPLSIYSAAVPDALVPNVVRAYVWVCQFLLLWIIC